MGREDETTVWCGEVRKCRTTRVRTRPPPPHSHALWVPIAHAQRKVSQTRTLKHRTSSLRRTHWSAAFVACFPSNVRTRFSLKKNKPLPQEWQKNAIHTHLEIQSNKINIETGWNPFALCSEGVVKKTIAFIPAVVVLGVGVFLEKLPIYIEKLSSLFCWTVLGIEKEPMKATAKLKYAVRTFKIKLEFFKAQNTLILLQFDRYARNSCIINAFIDTCNFKLANLCGKCYFLGYFGESVRRRFLFVLMLLFVLDLFEIFLLQFKTNTSEW